MADKEKDQMSFFDDVFSDAEMDALGARPEAKKPDEPAPPSPAPAVAPKVQTGKRPKKAKKTAAAAADDEDAGGSDSEGCEAGDEDEGGESTSSAKSAKRNAPAAATTRAPETKFKYPFRVRYAASFLDLTGFVDDEEYTQEQIKDLLIQNDFTEFRDRNPVFYLSDATNTVVITMQGSTKAGDDVWVMPLPLLQQIEAGFMATHEEHGTEDRALVYRDEDGNLGVVVRAMTRRRAKVRVDLPLTIEQDGRFWDLAYDLHSHHLMGAFWSGTDSFHENLRGTIFGVFSWESDTPTWLFRRWIGPDSGFQDLRYEDVVADIPSAAIMLEAGVDG